MSIPSAAPSLNSPESICQRYGLSYHLGYCQIADRMVGLKGKRVLEVGGSLPRELVLDHFGAQSWLGVEEMGYWKECITRDYCQGTLPERPPVDQLAQLERPEELPTHTIVEGAIEELPGCLSERFDLVFSIACFEHIHRMPAALDAMYRALVPGGKLFAMFSPLWSAPDGHHLPQIRDQYGRLFSFSSSPIPPWGHLLARPSQMLDYLRQHTDLATAREMVYYIYQSHHINRYFTEDYVAMVEQSNFEVEQIDATFPTQVPAETQALLEAHHPGRKLFANNGLLMVLKRP